MLSKNGKIYNILKNKLGDELEVYDYKKMNHGFVSRGDISVPLVRESVKKALL